MNQNNVKIGDIVIISLTGKVRDVGIYGFNMTGASGEAVVARYEDIDSFEVQRVFKVGQTITSVEEMNVLPLMTVLKNVKQSYIIQQMAPGKWIGTLSALSPTSYDLPYCIIDLPGSTRW